MLFNESEYIAKLKAIAEDFQEDLKAIKTGRASMETFQKIMVFAYGQQMNLPSVAKVSIVNATRVDVEVWDQTIVAQVEEALKNANLGSLNNGQSKNLFIINMAPLTQEDREKKVKEIAKWLEERKVKCRLVRQDYISKVDALDKVSEDDQKRSKEKIQQLLKDFEGKLDQIFAEKEEEIISIK